MILALSMFVFGASWIAPLNPRYAFADWTNEDTTVTQVTATLDDSGRNATLLSAFFGADDAFPPQSRFVFCPFVSGKDGMPVIFSHELDVKSVQAGDFRVTSQMGKLGTVACTTFSPASDEGELRTVLLGGDFGSSIDQPILVEVVGNILSADGVVNFKGSKVSVVPLEDGPRIALAESVPEVEWRMGAEATRRVWGGGGGCPVGTKQAVRVTWEGGITKEDRSDADDEIRKLYKVTFDGPNSPIEKAPTALADLGDGDNNHLLCFDFEGMPLEVHFPAKFLTDPRDDLNPDTRAPIGR